MDSSSVLIVGSANVDHVFRSRRLPHAGETILGDSFRLHAGGKGANQAVAAGLLGAKASFCGCVGDDSDGQLLSESLASAGLDLRFLHRTKLATGAAGIVVDEAGSNMIVVAPGANSSLTAGMVSQALAELQPGFVLSQLEIPIDAIDAAGLAERFILNPAPAQILSPELLHRCFSITPNETELEFLSGTYPADEASCTAACWKLLDQGVENVVVTLGARGSQWVSRRGVRVCPAPHVSAIDTTAAGDVFNGAFVTFLAAGRDMANAIELANHAAALSTTREGAQESAPTLQELRSFAPWLA